MKKLLLFLLPLLLSAESLKSLLEHAKSKNELVVSKSIAVDAKSSEVASSESGYFPTVDIGAMYQRFDEPNPFSPNATYGAYATVAFDVYSGGKKSSLLEQKRDEHRASKFELEASKKSLELQIVEDFYSYKILEANLESRLEASNAVRAQLERVERFYAASLATSDEVERLRAAFEKNQYAIESLRFELLRVKKSLELKVGKEIESLGQSAFKKEQSVEGGELESITARRYQKSALLNAADALESAHYPQIRIEDTFSFYGYEKIPSFPGGGALELPENQNKLLATLNMRIFDFGSINESSEALRLNANAIATEILYQNKEQQMFQELSKSRINTAIQKIKSTNSGLKAARSALETITKKYNNAIVDHVVYLDALTSYTEAKASYETSLYNLEHSYALYYYYNSKNLEEFLQ